MCRIQSTDGATAAAGAAAVMSQNFTRILLQPDEGDGDAAVVERGEVAAHIYIIRSERRGKENNRPH